MSKSTYGYQRRKYDSQIDWGQIGTDFGNAILDKEKEREAKRQEIEAQTREVVRTLDDAPMGEYKPANEFALQYSGDAQEYLLMINRSLKSGLLSPKEFTIMRENIKTDTSRLFDVVQEYQDEWALSMDRTKNSDNQELEVYIMESLEGFANLTSSRAYIDPAKGTVAIGKVDEDGNMIKKPGAFGSINALRNRMKSKFDRFDISAYVAPEIEKMGTFIDSIKEYGKITELLDPTQREFLDPDAEKTINAYEKFEDDLISSAMANPYNVTSVLTNTLSINPDTKERYRFVEDRDEFEKDPNAILLIDDGSGTLKPEFKDEQEKNVRQAIRAKMRNMIDQETKIRPVSPSAASQRAGDKRDIAKSYSDVLRRIWTGDRSTKDVGTRELMGLMNANIDKPNEKYEKTIIGPQGLRFVRINGDEEVLPFFDSEGRPLSEKDFMRGASFITDDQTVLTMIKNAFEDQKQFTPVSGGEITVKGYTMPELEWGRKTVEVGDEEISISDFYKSKIGKGSVTSGGKAIEIKEAIEATFDQFLDGNPTTITKSGNVLNITKKGGGNTVSVPVSVDWAGSDWNDKSMILMEYLWNSIEEGKDFDQAVVDEIMSSGIIPSGSGNTTQEEQAPGDELFK